MESYVYGTAYCTCYFSILCGRIDKYWSAIDLAFDARVFEGRANVDLHFIIHCEYFPAGENNSFWNLSLGLSAFNERLVAAQHDCSRNAFLRRKRLSFANSDVSWRLRSDFCCLGSRKPKSNQ